MEAMMYRADSDGDKLARELEAEKEVGSTPRQNTPDVAIDTSLERSLVRKLDLIVLPLAFYLYLFCFLDRTNIGNARVAGLEKDLHMKGYNYNVALLVFYIAYGLIEVPSNLVLRKIGAQIWIPTILIAFGLVSTLTAFVQSYWGLVATRIFLGVAEGGLMPAYLVVLSRFYTKRELIFRIAIFTSTATAAGMFGGLLAVGLLKLHIPHAATWRAIFLVEGLISIGNGILAFFVLCDRPATARFLTAEEKELAELCIKRENAGIRVVIEDTKAALIKRAFGNANTFACGFGFALTNIPVQSLAVFIPTIIRGIDPTLTPVQTNLKTIPIYAVAWPVSLFISWLATRYNRRAYTIMGVGLFCVLGYAILLGTKTQSINTRYAAIFLCAIGAYTPGPLFLATGIANAGLDQFRAISAGIFVSMGVLGAIVASWAYLPFDAPRYTIGNSLTMGAVVCEILLAGGLMVYNRRENALRARGGRDSRLEGKSEQEISELGYQHPDFKYQW